MHSGNETMPHIHVLRIDPQPPLVASALPFWHVWLNAQRISSSAYPFYARDRVIGLDARGEIPEWRRTQRRVSMRRVGSYAIWLPLLKSEGHDETTLDAPLAFHGTQYTAAIDKAVRHMQSNGIVLPDHSRNGGWYSMTPAELRETLQRNDPASATTPYYDNLLQGIREAIAQIEDFDVCDAPEKAATTLIKLENGKESRFHYGWVGDEIAVHFEMNPSFPLWVRSPAFKRVFMAEMFQY
jgi:hypothetical protein